MPPLSTERRITTRDFSLRLGTLGETPMRAMGVLTYEQFTSLTLSPDSISRNDRFVTFAIVVRAK